MFNICMFKVSMFKFNIFKISMFKVSMHNLRVFLHAIQLYIAPELLKSMANLWISGDIREYIRHTNITKLHFILLWSFAVGAEKRLMNVSFISITSVPPIHQNPIRKTKTMIWHAYLSSWTGKFQKSPKRILHRFRSLATEST